ncbi:hypothetical protein P9273_15845 [Mesorhizobium sp. WSM4935]|uniref:hypothetical protein n=1 Tax=Mesorhizobium sp. WSM4935 TaxID=3038547 RepID=UPI00241566D7|nr:hypothetical protein [Mesorhizobium sp. WSM4935]MDG4876568.1 hypothetical protein [Mesorhizobium sp. WSM4935]
MNWWIGSFWVLVSLGVAALDYRVQRLGGKRWLVDWPWRLAMYFALGGLVTSVPIFLYQFGEAIIGLYNHPPTAKMLVALLPSAVAAIVAVEVLKLAGRTIRRSGGSLQGRRLVVAIFLFMVAAGIIGAGYLGNLYLLRDH